MGKHHGQNNIVQGWEGGQFVQVLQCPIIFVISNYVSNYGVDIGNRRICLKSFVRGCNNLSLVSFDVSVNNCILRKSVSEVFFCF